MKGNRSDREEKREHIPYTHLYYFDFVFWSQSNTLILNKSSKTIQWEKIIFLVNCNGATGYPHAKE